MDDGHWFRAMRPLSASFICHKIPPTAMRCSEPADVQNGPDYESLISTIEDFQH